MSYRYFSHNGKVLPIEEAMVPLSSVEYAYGFGVYESIRLDKNTLYFGEEHCRRLMESAKVIGLEHAFDTGSVLQGISELIAKNKAETCNLKLLLVGGRTKDDANLYILCLNPLFPERKLYQTGAHAITSEYERDFPAAKTLNMLPSYLAYREAKLAGAYDALLVNRRGYVTEGTRTNFLAIKDKTIFSPPAAEILEGITRQKVLETARNNGFTVTETDIKLSDVTGYDGVFLTSTSSKIMPLRSINDQVLGAPPASLQLLAKQYNLFLQEYAQSDV